MEDEMITSTAQQEYSRRNRLTPAEMRYLARVAKRPAIIQDVRYARGTIMVKING